MDLRESALPLRHPFSREERDDARGSSWTLFCFLRVSHRTITCFSAGSSAPLAALQASLQGPADLVSQGLRTLELCIDSLQPEQLKPVRPCQPTTSRLHAHTTIRILGGKNRLLLHNDPELEFRVGQLTSLDKGYREHAFDHHELAKHCLTLVPGGVRGLFQTFALVVEDSKAES
ncbi:hypothetical protein AURDEDRAFT_175242 [Auricularia subglabra TFB-10046 SS5]|nr:hypothetical protein AURDEDRAFT_175242 [Auricularia subglabra TFB-10046 SS5]